MRRRTIIAALLAVALVAGTSAVAVAGNRIFASKPDIVSRHLELGREFKVRGYVQPASVSTDTVSSIVVRVLQMQKVQGSRPTWSQIATVPATWGKLLRRRAVTYEASITIAAAGTYRLRAAVVQTDTIAAQSAHRQLTLPKPKPRKSCGRRD
jgi:hypothetical protein